MRRHHSVPRWVHSAAINLVQVLKRDVQNTVRVVGHKLFQRVQHGINLNLRPTMIGCAVERQVHTVLRHRGGNNIQRNTHVRAHSDAGVLEWLL